LIAAAAVTARRRHREALTDAELQTGGRYRGRSAGSSFAAAQPMNSS